MWLLFAFSGPVLWAASTHIDKYLVEKYFKHSSVAVLMVFTSAIGLLALPVIWWWRPQVLAEPPLGIAVMVASGLLYMGAMLFYLQAIQSEEASVIAPLFQATVVWGFVLAYVLLGEMLTLRQAIGAALIIAAGALMSLNGRTDLRRFKIGLVLRMAACTFALALSTVIFKFFAVRDEFWSTAFWTFAGEAVFGVAVLAVPAYSRQLAALLRRSPAAVFSVNAANELINLGGGLGARYALLMAPVALVQAVTSTTVLFIFGFGVLLTVFFPALGKENLSRRNLIQKGFGAALVTAGVLLAGY